MTETGHPEPALFRLIQTLEELSKTSGGSPPPPEAAGDEPGGRDEDENHIYVWVELPDYHGPDIDISIHNRTLMIRFAKPEEEDD